MPKPSFSVGALLTRITVVALGIALFFPPGVTGGRLMTTPAYWVSLLAPAFFLVAVWSASTALVRIDRGDAFGPSMVRGLKEIGGCLMLGAFAAIVAQPSLLFLIGNGFREMRGARFNFDVENVTLALVGLMLVLLARQGQSLKSKLDQFV
jgi:hypothetical protein